MAGKSGLDLDSTATAFMSDDRVAAFCPHCQQKNDVDDAVNAADSNSYPDVECCDCGGQFTIRM